MQPGITDLTASAGTAVEVQALTLTAGGHVLLQEAAARFEAGEVTLIVGPSGVGKSLLLRVLAGLFDPSSNEVAVQGQVRIGEHDVLSSARRLPVGVVFQNFALFDELSPLDNVRFAQAHRPRQSHRQAIAPEQLLAELQVPHKVRTAALSGGQRQRLAIARTLAYNPEVILYDEPTSGLDVATASQVAELIRATHATHPQTSIIVTHDYEALAPIADRIYLLDPGALALKEVPRSQWHDLHQMLAACRAAALEVTPHAAATSASSSKYWQRKELGRLAGDFLTGTSRWVEQVLLLPMRLIPRWSSPLWGLRTAWHYLRLVASPAAWLYVAIAGAIAGFVATYFTFRFLPYRQYTEPLLIENLLHALGFSLYRILVPVLATILIAARCGAAVASDVGGKVYGRQIDALRTFGVLPERYLLTGILLAFLLGTPLLLAISFAAARWTSLAVFTATHPHLGPFYWESHFHYDLVQPGQWFYQGTLWVAGKTLCCAAGMGLIAYLRGMTPKHSTSDVSRGITSNILWATLWVLIVNFTFAFYEFD